MQQFQPVNNNYLTIYSAIIISNDSTSKLINIHKDTELQVFYQEICLKFPNLNDLKLFYYEGYSKKKCYVSNEEEYIIANKKGIEYFYLCENNNSNNELDYLRYYSVMLFCPVKRLNNDIQTNDRKKMKKKTLHLNYSLPILNANHINDYQMNNYNMNNDNINNNNYFNNYNNIGYQNYNYGYNNNMNLTMNNFNNQMGSLNLNNNNQYSPFNCDDGLSDVNYIPINTVPDIQTQIPEYETIDTESNPINRYIENAINFSATMKYIIISQKSTNPEYFIDIDETLSIPGLLYQNLPSPMDYQYILCLIGKILRDKGIKVGIYKQGYNIDRIDLSAIQFIFSGLINKKKYRLKFSQNINYINVMNSLSNKKKFIEKWKTKISNILNMDKSLIILTNIRNNINSLYIDLAFNPKVVEMNDKKLIYALVKGDIIKCEPVPLLAGCMLSPNIFSSQFNKFYNLIEPNKIIGGEEYIHPYLWTAYGINILGKYDFGNNIWLGNVNNIGEFAIAYHGINNINTNNYPIKKIESIMGNLETGKTFIKVKNIRNQNFNCKEGVYLYKNPLHAENSSELINIGGFEYKIMFMCRVNASKINQPENFKDCWILSPNSDEIRPYKILIKKIFKSPLEIASQGQIKIYKGSSPPALYRDIINQKDESYMDTFNVMNNNNMILFQNNQNNQNKYDAILREWTGSGAHRINSYLRDNIKNLPENILKSNVWCLHKAITKSPNNVPNNMQVYRGIKAKIPFNIGVGTKFYFQEFLSTSKDINIARNFATISGTLIIISIQNNGTNGKKVYCRDIENLSQFPQEREIIFTAFCQFIVTKIEKQNNLDVIYLTCDGYNF